MEEVKVWSKKNHSPLHMMSPTAGGELSRLLGDLNQYEELWARLVTLERDFARVVFRDPVAPTLINWKVALLRELNETALPDVQACFFVYVRARSTDPERTEPAEPERAKLKSLAGTVGKLFNLKDLVAETIKALHGHRTGGVFLFDPEPYARDSALTSLDKELAQKFLQELVKWVNMTFADHFVLGGEGELSE
jgi:type II secretory pathway component PulJ